MDPRNIFPDEAEHLCVVGKRALGREWTKGNQLTRMIAFPKAQGAFNSW
jgi:hypothetical protein